MSDEIEAKFAVEDHQSLRDRLHAVGATRTSVALQDERYFDHPDASLRDSDRALRLRVIQPIDPQTHQPIPAAATSTVVTYKGPRRDGHFKVRREVQFTADDPDSVEQLLHALGLTRSLRYGKIREIWRLDDCEICLDTLPNLGPFVEIEGPSESAVEDVRRRLALDKTPHEERSYLALLVDYCGQHGLDLGDIGQP